MKIKITTPSITILLGLLIYIISFPACKTDAPVNQQTDPVTTQEAVKVPAFIKDSAFAHVQKQVAFGPRVPGSREHSAARQWIVSKLKSYGASVTEQSFKATTATIGDVRATNIIASFNPSYARRIVLAAHWDTRFAADEDDQRVNDPIDGADDGGSGVGVLLEIGRLLKEHPISIGVDIVLFDAEDQGSSDGGAETWCLGAQHWAQNPHVKGYRAEFGILLDMVGAKGAVFQKENLTGVFPAAKTNRIHQLYDKLWSLAHGMGKSNLFLNNRSQPVTDDHYFVNLYTDIPMIDIIHKPVIGTKGFGLHWHTHDDNINIIDPDVLGAVGQIVTAFIYNATKTPM